MIFKKQQITLYILNSICFILLIPFFVLLIKTFTIYKEISFILLQSFYCLCFLFPFGVSVFYSTKLSKPIQDNIKTYKKLTKQQWLILSVFVVGLIILFYWLYNSVLGISTTVESIQGVYDGSVYSEIYSREQLLKIQNKYLYQNIFSCFLTIYMLFNFCFSSFCMFKKHSAK